MIIIETFLAGTTAQAPPHTGSTRDQDRHLILLGLKFDEARVEVVAGHAGPAYGIPHAATIEAIKLAGKLEAIPLDPVYSGKGLAGLIALIQDGRWKTSDNVVFIHTGGGPALFAYRETLEL
jgi:L-cysteate sulfo-lyase